MGRQIRFISGDGVEHEVDENSAAAAHMIEAGFQRLDDNGDPWHEDRDDLPAEEPEVTYTEADALAQNFGVDESTAAKAKAKKAPAKKKAA